MVQPRQLGDGQLVRTSFESLYGIAEKHGHMASSMILWANGSENIWATQHHGEYVTHWWFLFTAHKGSNAMLASFAAMRRKFFGKPCAPSTGPLVIAYDLLSPATLP